MQNIVSDLHLAWMLAKRDLLNRYISSYAGFFWNIGVPLFNALIMAIIFTVLMDGRLGLDYGDTPFVLFYFIPFSLWVVFAEVVGRSTGILREYDYLINKISFPYWVLPLIPLASALLNQFIILSIVAVLFKYFNLSVSNLAYIYFFIWLITLILTIGFAYAVSAISVYLQDLKQIVPLFINILFWLTPILYPPFLIEQKAPIWLKTIIISFNPFYYLSEYSRYSLLGTEEFPFLNLVMLLAISCILLFLGIFTFKKLKAGFADVI